MFQNEISLLVKTSWNWEKCSLSIATSIVLTNRESEDSHDARKIRTARTDDEIIQRSRVGRYGHCCVPTKITLFKIHCIRLPAASADFLRRPHHHRRHRRRRRRRLLPSVIFWAFAFDIRVRFYMVSVVSLMSKCTFYAMRHLLLSSSDFLRFLFFYFFKWGRFL